MDFDNLTDLEVSQLIERLKHPQNRITFNVAYKQITTLFGNINFEEPIIDDEDFEYFLKVYRGRIDNNRFSIHLRFKEFYHHLVRVDINPSNNHNNPDGTKIIGDHIHIYSSVHNPKDAVAIPLSDSDFPNVKNIVESFESFLSYNNIKQKG